MEHRIYHPRHPKRPEVSAEEKRLLIEMERRNSKYLTKLSEVAANVKKQVEKSKAYQKAQAELEKERVRYGTFSLAFKKRKEEVKKLLKKSLERLKERQKQKRLIRGGRIRDLLTKAINTNDTETVLLSLRELDRYVNEEGQEVGVKGVLHYIRDLVILTIGMSKLITMKVIYANGYERFVTLYPSNVERVISRILGEGDEYYKEASDQIVGIILEVVNMGIQSKNVRAAFIPLCIMQEKYEYDYSSICKDLQIMYHDKEKWCIDYVPYNCLSYSLKTYDSNYYVSPDYMVDSTVRRRDLGHVASDNNIYIVLHMFDKKGVIKSYRYGDKTDPKVDIGYFLKHYFRYNKINKHPEGGFVNSLRLIDWLYQEYILEQPPYEILYMLYRNLYKRDYEVPFFTKNLSNFFRPTKKFEPTSVKDTYICYLDTETNTSGAKHIVYLASVIVTYNNVSRMYSDVSVRGVLDWMCNLPNLTKDGKKKFVVYCHNLRYDASFIVPLTGVGKWFGDLSNCKGFQAYYSHYYNGKRNTYSFSFKDSYAMIPMKLEKFNDSLKLGEDSVKLDFPYESYNQHSRLTYHTRCSLESMVPHTKKKDINLLREVVVKAGALEIINNEEMVKMLQFSKYYCELDVKILQKGIEKMRSLVLDKWNIDIHSVMTISSLSDCIQKKFGVFEDVYEIGGPILNFLQKAQHGGRCLVRGGTKQHIQNKIAYGDMTSLYPTAMVRLGGYAKGVAKVVPAGTQYDELSKYTTYVVEIKITDVKNPKMAFPLITVPQSNGELSKVYDDDYRGNIVVSKIELDCLVKYEGITFEVLGGYYWDEGRNNKLGECIQGMFDERVKYPKDNPMNGVLKLLLNSAYGKTIQKAYSKQYESKWFKKHEDFIDYIYNNSHMIDGYIELGTQSIIEKTVPTFDHFNRCLAGIEVLAMSKLIMYEIFDVCEKNNIDVYYTDTDSFAVEYDKWKLLSDKYLEMTNRVFEGSKLGQSHLDFEPDDTGNKVKEGTLYATEAIYLDRKCYCLRVRYEDLEGIEHTYFQYRMKGVPHTSIQLKAEQLGLTIMELYHKLYRDGEMEFDLLENGNRVRFEYQKDFSVRSVREFKRSLQFTKGIAQ